LIDTAFKKQRYLQIEYKGRNGLKPAAFGKKIHFYPIPIQLKQTITAFSQTDWNSPRSSPAVKTAADRKKIKKGTFLDFFIADPFYELLLSMSRRDRLR
jgi:hypothetical protein